jgi:hypothetical protein
MTFSRVKPATEILLGGFDFDAWSFYYICFGWESWPESEGFKEHCTRPEYRCRPQNWATGLHPQFGEMR